MKNVFIMGDSYSTYEGYIPDEYHFYYSDNKQDRPIVCGVEKTWWKLLARENNLNIVVNDSFSGSTVCNTVRPNLNVASSFISRIDKYIAEKFFDTNKIDTFLIFGGTNDSWINAPVGTFVHTDWTENDLKCVLPAFCYLLSKVKNISEEIIVIVNSELSEVVTKGIVKACEEYGVKYVRLKDIDKECGHPTEFGMRQIAEQVASQLNN